MFARCIRDLSSGRSLRRIPRPVTAQMPFLRTSRNEFSNAPKQNPSQKTVPVEETPNARNSMSKIVLGSVVVGAAAMAAYQAGFIDLKVKDGKSTVGTAEQNVIKMPENLENAARQDGVTVDGKQSALEPETETVEVYNELHLPKDLEVNEEVVSEIPPPQEESAPAQEKEPETLPQETVQVPDDQTSVSNLLSESNPNLDSKELYVEEKAIPGISNESEGIDGSIIVTGESGVLEAASHHDKHTELPKDQLDAETVAPKSLSESYSLHDEGKPEISIKGEGADAVAAFSSNKEALVANKETPVDEKLSDDGRILLDLIDAIHAAERKQAESDAYKFSEEKRMLKEKYEKELKDARARELMFAEEVAILEKELKKEKVKTATAIKTLQEKAEQNLREELKRKEEETAEQLEKVQELAKAELSGAIAKEKAAQIERIAEANLNINALCMAFYARSEEARQSHSVHKLALGTLALEEALSKGLPVRTEVDSLRKSLEGIDKDSLLELALSTLPEQVLDNGTDTQMKLNQKFNSLKGTLRHFSLIPAGGGGILAHAVAHVASSIKMKEDQLGDGIESVIARVENFLSDGKLAEAAEALEEGVHGSEASEVIVEWVMRARSRAIAEQTLALLQSYATSITFS
ncbi:MICOS complex subunit MIC60 [Ananas comosus]|uniref:MICOS complex subunit MIC60 n=2 Tax=Ananas comosus TaxID=4615 RepID=A0A6P5EFL5_ANACO|nr:MICOS complex subunit MIC60 [Ananas comosus]CAD1826379.1 unnamed protein product [Ananas comosus var. bracteatus]